MPTSQTLLGIRQTEAWERAKRELVIWEEMKE
jgi:hypothetical protein